MKELIILTKDGAVASRCVFMYAHKEANGFSFSDSEGRFVAFVPSELPWISVDMPKAEKK